MVLVINITGAVVTCRDRVRKGWGSTRQERERGKERETERKTEIDRQTDRHTDIRKADTKTHRLKQTNESSERQTCI